MLLARVQRIPQSEIPAVTVTDAVENGKASGIVVLIESFARVPEGHATYRAMVRLLVVPAQLEPVPVSRKSALVPYVHAVAEGPAIFEHDLFGTVVGVVPVIRIFPGSAIVKAVAGSLGLLGCKTVGHASRFLRIVIP